MIQVQTVLNVAINVMVALLLQTTAQPAQILQETQPPVATVSPDILKLAKLSVIPAYILAILAYHKHTVLLV